MKKNIINFLRNSNIWVAILSVVALALMVLPMAYISRYMWPVSDDFELSLWTKAAFEETGSIWSVLKKAWDFTVYKYFNWQGAYSSIFLMALQPGIWGDEYYWMGVILVIGSLFAAVYWMGYVLIVKYAGAKKSIWLIITSLVSFMWMLYLPYTEEAFYWWTGASYYMGFYAWALMILAVAFMIYRDWDDYRKVKKSLLSIAGVLACLFVGGGNFPTTLLLLLVLIGLCVYSKYNKRKSLSVLLAYSIATLTALLLSVLAPGNANHMNADFEVDISAFEAILISIRDGFAFIGSWTNIRVILLYVFLLPFIWQMARECKLKFKYPLVATILSGGLYLAEYAPVSYAFGGFPPGRMINLYYINFYWLIFFNVFYWTGWIHKRFVERKAPFLRKAAEKQRDWQSVYIILAGGVFLGSIWMGGKEATNLYWMYREYRHGYYEEVYHFIEDRVAYFEAHQGEDVAVDRIPHECRITYFSDLFADKDHIVNTTMAEYYGVNSISLKEE